MNEAAHLNRYQKEKVLFEGVFTKVWQVRDLLTGEPRVLKASDLEQYPCSNSQQLFNELVLHGLVSSPYVIRKLLSFQVGSLLYVVLDFAHNGDLFAYGWIDQRPMDDAFIRKIFYQTCLATKAVHGRGLVHRDIKPENILLDKNFDVKLCDFGWACEVDDPLASSDQAGTLAYMPPEAFNYKSQTYSADIWALAVLLYEMYHKTEPFRGSTMTDRLHSIMTTKPVFNPQFPPDAADIFYQCTAIDPSKRPSLEWILGHPFLKEFTAKPIGEEVLKQDSERAQPSNDQQVVQPLKHSESSEKMKKSPYIEKLIPSASSIELSIKNQGSNYVPLLSARRNLTRQGDECSLEREKSIVNDRIKTDRSFDGVLPEKQTSVNRKRQEPKASRYRPLSTNRKQSKTIIPKTGVSQSIHQQAQNLPSIKNVLSSAEVYPTAYPNARNSSLEHSVISNFDFTAKVTTATDLINSSVNLYSTDHTTGHSKTREPVVFRSAVCQQSYPSAGYSSKSTSKHPADSSLTRTLPHSPLKLSGHPMQSVASPQFNIPLKTTLTSSQVGDQRSLMPSDRKQSPLTPATTAYFKHQKTDFKTSRLVLKPHSEISLMNESAPRYFTNQSALNPASPLAKSKITVSTIQSSRDHRPSPPRAVIYRKPPSQQTNSQSKTDSFLTFRQAVSRPTTNENFLFRHPVEKPGSRGQLAFQFQGTISKREAY